MLLSIAEVVEDLLVILLDLDELEFGQRESLFLQLIEVHEGRLRSSLVFPEVDEEVHVFVVSLKLRNVLV